MNVMLLERQSMVVVEEETCRVTVEGVAVMECVSLF